MGIGGNGRKRNIFLPVVVLLLCCAAAFAGYKFWHIWKSSAPGAPVNVIGTWNGSISPSNQAQKLYNKILGSLLTLKIENENAEGIINGTLTVEFCAFPMDGKVKGNEIALTANSKQLSLCNLGLPKISLSGIIDGDKIPGNLVMSSGYPGTSAVSYTVTFIKSGTSSKGAKISSKKSKNTTSSFQVSSGSHTGAIIFSNESGSGSQIYLHLCLSTSDKKSLSIGRYFSGIPPNFSQGQTVTYSILPNNNGVVITDSSGNAYGFGYDYTSCSNAGSSTQTQTQITTPTQNQNTAILPDIVISTNTTLIQDVHCHNFTVLPGVTLTTNGYNIFCAGTFDNQGTIVTGADPFQDYPNSYGGSGGGGGASCAGTGGQTGYSTLAPGGNGFTQVTPGSSAPNFMSSSLGQWLQKGITQYLAGAGGGGNPETGYSGAPGSCGIYIQANEIISGTIFANGQNAGSSRSGGGGGGVIILAYGSGGYQQGTLNVSGGGGNSGGCYPSGNGGNGQIFIYNYGLTPPINP
ncbi:MAG: hypothetical protein M1421_05320 [Candidatus Eremiobacteraeota bacterium]|nr:hypothetical protein [Candidatus Eremiobacteraeota bacterium]MCL5054835.1 hypothetical protein [Bacillota bacterium]